MPAYWAHCSALAPTVDSPYSSQRDPVKHQSNQGIPLLKTLRGPLISPKRRARISLRPHQIWHTHTTLPTYHVVSHMSLPQSLLQQSQSPHQSVSTPSTTYAGISLGICCFLCPLPSISLRLLLISLRILIQMSMNLHNHSI